MMIRVFAFMCLMVFSTVISVSAAEKSEFGSNPIDKYYFEQLCNTTSTANERFVAADYIKAWEIELRNAAGSEAQNELALAEKKAGQAMDTEMAKWNGGTGGPGAGMIAYGQVYRDRALELIRQNRKSYVFYANGYQAPYMPLLQALANSQVIHYDAFDSRPDAQTANLTMYNAVASWSLPILRGKAPSLGQAYALRHSMEDPKKPLPPDNIKPEALYGDIFATGRYVYPSNKYQDIILGTQVGLLITPKNLAHKGELWIVGGTKQGDIISLRVLLTRLKYGNQDEIIGRATIVLRRDPARSSGYAIVAYHPEYERFEDVGLLR